MTKEAATPQAGPRALYQRLTAALDAINTCERVSRMEKSTQPYQPCMEFLGASIEQTRRQLQKEIRSQDGKAEQAQYH